VSRRIATALTAAAVTVVLITGAASGGSSAPGQQPPLNVTPPSISGNAQVGSLLTAAPGTWKGKALKYAYQWLRCDSSGASCRAITGARTQTYSLSTADAGATARVIVTATNRNGSAAATSAATAVISPATTEPLSGSSGSTASAATSPSNTSPPTISGTAQQGQTLNASTGSWSGTTPISYAYQWQRCDSAGASCAPVAGATGTTYLLVSADVASTMRVSVAASNSAGSATASSAPTAVVGAPSPTGNVLYRADWETMDTSAGYAVPPGWGAQCRNNPAFPSNQSFAVGSYTRVTDADIGSFAARFDLPAYTGGSSSCELLHGRKVGLNLDDYYAFAVKFPTDWQTPSTAGWGALLDQLNFEGINAAPVMMNAFADSLVLLVNSGNCPSSGGCPYYSGLPTGGGFSPRPAGMPGPLYAIPHGGMTLGVWHELVVHVRWTLDSTGVVEVWHRVKGQSAWTQTVSASGFPTLQTGTKYNGTLITASNIANWGDDDKFGVYRGPSSNSLSVYHDNWCRATSFGAAASCVTP
jgi:Polysaccharide lyase